MVIFHILTNKPIDMNRIFIICIILIFNLSSCGTQHIMKNEEDISSNTSYPELLDEIVVPLDIIYKWKLEILRSNANESFVKITNNDKAPTLEINQDSRVNGYDGCNSYGGRITFVEGNNIAFSSFLSTSKGCPPSIYWHNQFYKAFNRVNNYEIRSGNLLLKEDSHTLMTFSKPNK